MKYYIIKISPVFEQLIMGLLSVDENNNGFIINIGKTKSNSGKVPPEEVIELLENNKKVRILGVEHNIEFLEIQEKLYKFLTKDYICTK